MTKEIMFNPVYIYITPVFLPIQGLLSIVVNSKYIYIGLFYYLWYPCLSGLVQWLGLRQVIWGWWLRRQIVRAQHQGAAPGYPGFLQQLLDFPKLEIET